MNGIWKKTSKRFVHDFKRLDKDEKVAKINKAVVGIANTLILVWMMVTLRSPWKWF